MRRIIYIAIPLVLATLTAYGQSSLAVQYSINFPMGSTSDYIKETSFRGVTVDYRYMVQPMIGIGGSVGWYTFYEAKGYDSYTNNDGVTVSGRQYRYINSSPLLFVVDYYLNPGEKISPFAGLGIGTTYNRIDTMMGMYDVETDSWHFTLAPEVGVTVGIKPGLSGYLSARYNYSFETDDLDKQSFLTVNVGLAFGTAVFSSTE